MKDFDSKEVVLGTEYAGETPAAAAPVAIDGAVTSSAPRAWLLHDAGAGDLSSFLPVRLGDRAAEAVRVARTEAELAALAAEGRADPVDLPADPAARARFLKDWAKKAARKNRKGLVPMLLLPLAACGDDDDPATFTVTEAGGAVTFGGTATGDITVRIAGGNTEFVRGGIVKVLAGVNVFAGAAVEIVAPAGATVIVDGADVDGQTLKATGAGHVTIVATDGGAGDVTDLDFAIEVDLDGGNLTFDLSNDNEDTITLAGTIDLGTGQLIVDDGTVIAIGVTFGTIGGVQLNSELILTPAQLAEMLDEMEGEIEGDGDLIVDPVDGSQDEADAIAALDDGAIAHLLVSAAEFTALFTAPNDGNLAKLAADATVILTDTTLDAAEAKTILDAIGAGRSLDLSAADLVEGVATDLTALYDAANVTGLGDDEDVTFTDASVMAATANAIALASTGTVTATLNVGGVEVADDLADLVAELTDDQVNAYTIEFSLFVEVNAADLLTLAGKTSVTIDATGVYFLTGTLADVAAVLDSAEIDTSATDDSIEVTITDEAGISVAQANALNGRAEIDVITAKISHESFVEEDADGNTLADLDDNEEAGTENAYTITIADTEINAGQLQTLDDKTSVEIDATACTHLTGAADDIREALVEDRDSNNIEINNSGTIAVTVTDDLAATQATDLNAIDLETSAWVNATAVTGITGTVADLITALGAQGLNLDTDVALEATDQVLSAHDLRQLDLMTTGTITLNAANTLRGTYDDLKTLFDSDDLESGDGITSVTVEVTEAITVAQANDLENEPDDDDFTGAIAATILDTDMATLATLAGTGNAYTITVADAVVDAGDLAALYAKTTVAVNASPVQVLTGTVGEIATVLTAAGEVTGLGDEQVILSGNVTAAEIETLTTDHPNLGLVTVTGTLSGTASELAALGADILGAAANITAAGTASFTEAVTLLSAQNSGTTTIAGVQVTVEQALSLPIGANDTITAVTVTGTVTAAQAAALDTLAGQSYVGSVSYDAIPETGDATVTVGEDVAYTFSADDFAFSDADGGSLASVIIHAAPAVGTLEYDGGAIGTYPFTVDAADIDRLTFEPAADENGAGYASISFTVVDDEGTESGSATITVDVAAANDAPTLGGTTTGGVQEDSVLAASGALTIDDPDAGESVFAAAADTTTYGSYTLTSDGVWTYSLDNSNPTVQALGAGETTTDTFTAVSADGTTTETVTITITGTNDAAVISGATTGAATEGGAAITGTVTATDVDGADDTFTVVAAGTASTGGYGTYELTAGGDWTYTLDSLHATVEALGAGDTLTDTFTAVSEDGTEQTVTITITGTDDAPTIGGAVSGGVEEDSDLAVSGTLTITDPDAGESVFAAAAATSVNGYGSYTLTSDGVWTYSLDNSDPTVQALGAGETTTDTFTAVSADGTTTETVTITITGTNDAAVIAGVTTGAATEGGAAINGTLTASDVDGTDDTFTEVTTATNSDGGYGTYTLTAGGVWTYTLDSLHATVEALGAGDTLTDTFTAVSEDGTEQTVTITINGTNEDIDASDASDADLQTWAAEIDDIDTISDLTLTIDGATAANARDQVFAEVSDAQAEALFTKATDGVTITGNDGADWIDLRGLETSGVGFTIDATDTAAASDGANVIYAGDGDDHITTGDGADYIEVGPGNDTVDAGGGDDVIAVRALHNGAASDYDGGAGTDTLRVYGTNDLTGSTLTSIETLDMLPGSPSRVTMTVEQVDALTTITGAEDGSELVIVEADGGGAKAIDLSGTTITGLNTLTAGPGVTVTVGVTQLAQIGEFVTEGDGEIEITDLDGGESLTDDVDLSGADLGGDPIDLDVNGQTLTLTAEQANGATLSGTGDVRIIGSATYDDGALNLGNVDAGLDVTFVAAAGATVVVTANTWFDGTGSGDGNTDRVDAFEIEEGATLTIASDQAYTPGPTPKDITGIGNLIVELVDNDAFDLSGIAGTVTASAIVAGGDTVTLNTMADLGGLQIEVQSGGTLNLTAAQANGATITGEGTVVVSDLEDNPGAKLNGLAGTLTVTATIDLDDLGSDLNVTTDLSQVDTLEISGAYEATVDAGATLKADGGDATLTISVDAASTLSISAEDSQDLVAITGTGDVTITALEDAADADLSHIATDLDVTAELATSSGSDVDVSADLSAVDMLHVTGDGTAVIVDDADVGSTSLTIDVAAAATLEIGAADAAALAGVTGPGTVDVTGLEAAPGADLSGVGEPASFGKMVFEGIGPLFTAGSDNLGYTVNGLGRNINQMPADMATLASDIETTLNIAYGPGAFDVFVQGDDLVIEALVAGQTFDSGVFNDTGGGSINADIDASSPGTTVNVSMEMTENTDVTANLSTADTLTVSSDGTGPFTATIEAGATLNAGLAITVTDGSTLSLSAADVSAVTSVAATEAGAVVAVTALEGQTNGDGHIDADLSGVTADSLTAALDSTGDVTIDDAADLGDAVVTITGSDTVTVEDNATIGGAEFVIATDATLSLAASQATGLSVTEADPGGASDGTVTVTALEATTNADLSGIVVDTLNASLHSVGGVTIQATANLGTAAVMILGTDTVTVTDGATIENATFGLNAASTLQLSAAEATGLQVADNGNGTVDVTDTTFTADTDLSGITTNAIWFNGSNIENLTVDGGVTLTIRQDHLDDINSIADGSGAGNVTVTEVDGSLDLSEIGVTGTVTADIAGSVSFGSGDTNLDVVDTFLVGEGDSLTIDADNANGKTITASGNGTVTITGAVPGTEYDFANVSAEAVDGVTVEFVSTGTLNADSTFGANTQFTVAENETLTLSAAQADGVTIVGDDAGDGEQGGSVVITTLDGAAAYDLSEVTGGGATGTGAPGTARSTITSSTTLHTGTQLGALDLTVNADQTLTLTGAQATNRDIEGAGSLVVTAFADDTDLQNVAGSIDTVTGRVDGGDADVSGNASVNAGVVDAFVVTSGNELTLDDGLFADDAGTGLTVSRDGDVVVTGALVTTEYDFSDITATGTVRVAFDDAGGVDAATVLTGVDELALQEGGTTELTQAQADGIAFTGGGPVTITANDDQQSLSGTTLDDTFHADDDAGTIDLLDISQGGSDTLVFTTAANGFLVTGFDVGGGANGDVIDLSGAGLGLRNEHASSDVDIDFQYYDNTNTDLTGEVIVFTELLAGSAASIATVFNFTIEGVKINDLIEADGNAGDGSDLLFVIANDANDAVNIWRWQDTGGAANDGNVQQDELTLVTTLDGLSTSDLPNLDASNLIT